MTRQICSRSWVLRCWEKWIMFNSDRIETDMQNSESRETDDKRSVFHERFHCSLYSSISSWEDHWDFWKQLFSDSSTSDIIDSDWYEFLFRILFIKLSLDENLWDVLKRVLLNKSVFNMSNVSESLMIAQVLNKMINNVHKSELNSSFSLESSFVILFQLERSDLSITFFLKNLFDIKTSSILRCEFTSTEKFLLPEMNFLCLKSESITMTFSIDVIVRQMLHIITRK